MYIVRSSSAVTSCKLIFMFSLLGAEYSSDKGYLWSLPVPSHEVELSPQRKTSVLDWKEKSDQCAEKHCVNIDIDKAYRNMVSIVIVRISEK